MLWIPLARALSPFPAIDVDPTWALARGWALPVTLAGASAGVAFLTRHAALLTHLAPQTRWGGELGTLLLVPALLCAALATGAWVGAGDRAGAVPFGLGCARLDLYVAAVAILWLRVPASAAVRVAGLWLSVGLAPAMLHGLGLAGGIDASQPWTIGLGGGDSSSASPQEFATLLLSTAGLLVVGRFLPPPRPPARRFATGPR